MKTISRILVYGFVAVLIIPFLVPFPLKVAWTLVFGWIAFLARTLPKVTVNWSVIGMSVLCTAVLLAALHCFCAWLARARNDGARWQFRSTFAVFGILCALFLTTMGITGVVHQVAWLAASDEPWAVNARRKWAYFSALKNQAWAVQMALDDNDWDAIGAQQMGWEGPKFGDAAIYSSEAFHVLFFPAEGRITNAVVFHRDPVVREKVGEFCLIRRGNGPAMAPLSELGRFVPQLASH